METLKNTTYSAIDIKTGDVGICIDNKTLLSKIIRTCMGMYELFYYFELPKNKLIPYHTFNFKWEDNVLWVYEISPGKALKRKKYYESYFLSDNWLLLTPKNSYSEHEIDRYNHMIDYYYRKKLKYDLFGILFQLILIVTGKWYGPKGKHAEKVMYCSELTATLANKVRPYEFVSGFRYNPIDIIKSDVYTVILR